MACTSHPSSRKERLYSLRLTTDFAEETADGKNTTHGTITVVCQKKNVPGEVIAPTLEVSEAKT